MALTGGIYQAGQQYSCSSFSLLSLLPLPCHFILSYSALATDYQLKMEKTVTHETTASQALSTTEDVLPARGRVQYAADVLSRLDRADTERSRSRSRRGSFDSMSIRPARRSIDPALALPPQYRTMSFNIEESQRKGFNVKDTIRPVASKSNKKNAKQAEIGMLEADHLLIQADYLQSSVMCTTIQALLIRY